MYKQRSYTEVITSNKTVINDGFNSLYLKNIGLDTVRVFENLVLKPDAEFWFNNHPEVTMSSDVQISFAGDNADKQICIMKIYIDKI